VSVNLVCHLNHRSSKLKISCPSCEAKYSIGDEKVQNRLAKIRCRKCGADIVIDGRVEPPSITLGGADGAGAAVATFAASAPQQEFTVDFAENDQRTLGLSNLVAAYNSGQVTADTFVWAEGMSDWTPLGQVEAIVAALNDAAAPASARATTAQTSAQRLSGSPKQSQNTTARATAKGAGRDLFGKISGAGSEEDVAAAGAYDAHPAATTTGARNESSVLFSLSALTASTTSKPSVPIQSASVTSAFDDSGLIDLKALASQANAAESTGSSPLGAAPLGMAPLGGLGAPLGGAPFGGGPSPLSAADLAMPPPKSKTGLFIGGGIALAALIVVIAMALRPEPPPPPQPEPLPLPKPTHTAEPMPEPTTSNAAKPPPTGTEDSSQKAKPKYTGVRKKAKSDGSTGSGSEGSTPVPAPAKKAADDCHGDFQCELKKAARGH
jgi:predicted Zn finger-like uncharacterized protein